jgi:hypothetical protein
MPGSNAEDIVFDYLELEEWTDQLVDTDAGPDLELPPLPPPAPPPSAA